MSDILLNL